MADEKKKKNYETDFSFSFAGIADKITDTLGSMGDEPETAYFENARENETSAQIKLSGSFGKFHVHSVDDPRLLVKAETRHIGKMRFNVESKDNGAHKVVTVENEVMKGGLRGVFGGFGKRADLYIDVALTPSLPLNVRVDGGLGEALIDLRDLNLSEFKFDGGVGTATVYLPDGDYKATIEGGVGPAFVHLPAVTANKVKVEGGVGPMTVNVAEDADLTLDVEGGVGPITINVPAGSPLMIEWESGLGPLNKPSGLVQKNKNLWHTEGYDLAGKSVYLKLEGGVGPARVNFVTPDGEPVSNGKNKRDTFDV
jgi:hypothetical protein